MRRVFEIAVVAGVVAVGALSAGRIGWQDSPQALPFVADEFLIAPVRVHLIRLNDTRGIGTRLSHADIERVFRKANGIWHGAGIHLWVESIVSEKAHGRSESDTAGIMSFRDLRDLRPHGSRANDMLHVYYVGRMSINGLYLDSDGLFVQEASALDAVPGGIDEPLPRVTAHEIGHAFQLRHRQAKTNLMASGTTGTLLNAEEIAIARRGASALRWVLPAETFLKTAESGIGEGPKQEAESRLRAILSLPGSSVLKDRAAARLNGKR